MAKHEGRPLFPLACRLCGEGILDSLELYIHIGAYAAGPYTDSKAKPCQRGGGFADIEEDNRRAA